MFGEGEGLKSPVKFAVAAAYDKFAGRWEMAGDKLRWVDVWPPLLERFSVQEINAAADYCAKEFRRPPVPVEFIARTRRPPAFGADRFFGRADGLPDPGERRVRCIERLFVRYPGMPA